MASAARQPARCPTVVSGSVRSVGRSSRCSSAPFERSQVPLSKWLMALYMMSANKNGVGAFERHRTLGVTNKTDWFMLHRIREAMKRGSLAEPMTGTIVADETWIGGKPSNRHASARNTPVALRAAENARTDKTPVLSLINTATGEVRSAVVPNVTGAVLAKVIASQVSMSASTLYTDSGAWYGQLGREFASTRRSTTARASTCVGASPRTTQKDSSRRSSGRLTARTITSRWSTCRGTWPSSISATALARSAIRHAWR